MAHDDEPNPFRKPGPDLSGCVVPAFAVFIAVSLDETIRQRTALYLLMVVLSAALLIGAVYLGRRLTSRLGTWSATLVTWNPYGSTPHTRRSNAYERFTTGRKGV